MKPTTGCSRSTTIARILPCMVPMTYVFQLFDRASNPLANEQNILPHPTRGAQHSVYPTNRWLERLGPSIFDARPPRIIRHGILNNSLSFMANASSAIGLGHKNISSFATASADVIQYCNNCLLKLFVFRQLQVHNSPLSSPSFLHTLSH